MLSTLPSLNVTVKRSVLTVSQIASASASDFSQSSPSTMIPKMVPSR